MRNCPSCDVEMVDLELNDERVSVCNDCGGLWVDVADLNRLLLHHNQPGLESLGGRVEPQATTATCRDCQIDLTRIEARTRQDTQFYESCESCGRVFIQPEDVDPPQDVPTAQQVLISFFRSFGEKTKVKAHVAAKP